MNRFLIILAASFITLSACGKAPEQPQPDGSQDGAQPAASAQDTQETRDAVVSKAWDFLKTMYNKPAPEGDNHGILSGWGPASMNVPYTAMVLQGLMGSAHWKADETMIRDSMTWLMENQETTGAWSIAPGVDHLKGIRAVYVTSICAQLFAEANGAAGPWRGRLSQHIALARDYLKQSQVGNPEGPAPDYAAGSVGYGGWAYSREEIARSVGEQGKPAANMSTTAFAMDALKACGLSPEDPLWERAVMFLKRNQNAGEVQEEGFVAVDQETGKRIKPAQAGSQDYGGAIYSEETSKADGRIDNEDGSVTLFSYGSMTYNLLRAYLFAGLEKDSVPVQLAYAWIQRNYTLERIPGFRDEKQHEMGIYYYYLSMAKTLEAWGEDYVEDADRGIRHNWRSDIVNQLASRQREDGHWVNDVHDRWQENSPVLCTAYVLNALKHTR